MCNGLQYTPENKKCDDEKTEEYIEMFMPKILPS